MLVDKQSELMSDLLFTVHQHGGDDERENCKKTINSTKNYLLADTTTTTLNYFYCYRLTNSKWSFLLNFLIKHMVHASSCTAEL